jgi:hypothetical protein
MRDSTIWKRLSALFLASAMLALGGEAWCQVANFPGQQNGLNLIRPAACTGTAINNVDYLIVYPSVGGYFYTSDPLAVVALAGYCGNGNEFYIRVNGGFWDLVYVVPRMGLP